MPAQPFSSTTNTRIGKGFLIVAMLYGIASAWRWYVEASFIGTSSIAYGTAVSTDAKKESAEVVFQDLSGKNHTLKPWARSSSRKYEVGEKVVVLFDPQNPKEAKFNESMQLWATTHLFLYVWAISGLIGVLTVRGTLVWRPLHRKRIWFIS